MKPIASSSATLCSDSLTRAHVSSSWGTRSSARSARMNETVPDFNVPLSSGADLVDGVWIRLEERLVGLAGGQQSKTVLALTHPSDAGPAAQT